MKIFLRIIIVNVLLASPFINGCAKKSSEQQVTVLSENTKIGLKDGNYFSYNFDKNPKLGIAILKIEIFNKNDKKITNYKITGNAGMPSMKEMGYSGVKEFNINKFSNYLFPFDIGMTGDWEININITKSGAAVFSGVIKFGV